MRTYLISAKGLPVIYQRSHELVLEKTRTGQIVHPERMSDLFIRLLKSQTMASTRTFLTEGYNEAQFHARHCLPSDIVCDSGVEHEYSESEIMAYLPEISIINGKTIFHCPAGFLGSIYKCIDYKVRCSYVQLYHSSFSYNLISSLLPWLPILSSTFMEFREFIQKWIRNFKHNTKTAFLKLVHDAANKPDIRLEFIRNATILAEKPQDRATIVKASQKINEVAGMFFTERNFKLTFSFVSEFLDFRANNLHDETTTEYYFIRTIFNLMFSRCSVYFVKKTVEHSAAISTALGSVCLMQNLAIVPDNLFRFAPDNRVRIPRTRVSAIAQKSIDLVKSLPFYCNEIPPHILARHGTNLNSPEKENSESNVAARYTANPSAVPSMSRFDENELSSMYTLHQGSESTDETGNTSVQAVLTAVDLGQSAEKSTKKTKRTRKPTKRKKTHSIEEEETPTKPPRKRVRKVKDLS